MFVHALEISNFRCFTSVRLDLRHPDARSPELRLPNVNLILGNNGAGKSAILRAIALATLAPVISSSGLVPYRLVRRTRAHTAKEARVEARVGLHGQDVGSKEHGQLSTATTATRVERIRDVERVVPDAAPGQNWEAMFDDSSPAFLVVGYGASRRVESGSTFDESVRSRSRQLRYQRVSGLFEDAVTLVPLSAWLPALQRSNPGRYKQAVNLIDQLVPEECRFMGEMDGPEYVFDMRGTPIPFGALSDGYRAYIGWIADLLYHVCMAPSGARLVENRGIVLVDEIDLHLHPEWQRTVVPKLATTLPNLQFVLSTHSPIVAGTLQAENIFLTEPQEDGSSAVHQLEEQVYGRSSEQILLSSYFNLETTRAAETEDELSRLAQRAGEGDASASIEYMQRLTKGSGKEPAAANGRRRRR